MVAMWIYDLSKNIILFTEQENLYWFLKKQWKHVEELGPIVVVGSAIVIAGIRVVVDGGHEVFKLP